MVQKYNYSLHNDVYLKSKYRSYCIMNFRQQRIQRVFLLRELAFVLFLLHELDLFTTCLHLKEYYGMFTLQQLRQYNRTQYHNL